MRDAKTGSGRTHRLLDAGDETGCHYDNETPASVRNWLNRRSLKLRRIDARWADEVLMFREAPPARVVVLLHVYFQDLVEEILKSLRNIPVAFDLVITNASASPISDLAPMAGANKFVELMVPNHGRDILPMIHAVNAGLLDDYELVFKVHTKKSEWREGHEALDGTGDQWRQSFLRELAGTTYAVKNILSNFAEDPSLGALTSEGNVLGAEFWGDNHPTAAQLLWRLQLHLKLDIEFAAGSIYWIRGFLLQGLYGLELEEADFEPELGQVNATTAHAVERVIGLLTTEAGYATRSVSQLAAVQSDSWSRFQPDSNPPPAARVVPFYLPQFHSVPENDRWWGKGFTEWNNVASARPNFVGHNQPFLPSELGYYNLADDSVRAAQGELARRNGIAGFMYYYYWFAGRKLLNKPIESLKSSGEDTPFCVMWANENWTRSWDGGSSEILLGQDYETHPATEFVDDIADLLRDSRYIRIDGKPVIAVYRIAQLDDPSSVVQSWRQRAHALGIGEIFVLTCDVGSAMDGLNSNPLNIGLDGVLEFPPHNHYWAIGELTAASLFDSFAGRVMSYGQMADRAEERLFRKRPDPWRFPGVMVNFDNTARRQNSSDVWVGSNPYTFRRWLSNSILALMSRPFEERIVFVNAWNEWAEGAVLEPSVRWGHGFLHAVRSAVWS